MRIEEYLGRIDYPGRIIALGCRKDGLPFVLYGITGRSVNSRNRVLRKKDGIVRTEPFDESMVTDPSLIIYNAVRSSGESIICTNGAHTDTISDTLSSGGDIEDALIRLTYEPDAPICTPRISGIIDGSGYALSIIRKDGNGTLRLLYRYGKEPGTGHIIHTYRGSDSHVESFDSLPVRFDIADGAAESAWNALSTDRRVALYAREGDHEVILNAKEV